MTTKRIYPIVVFLILTPLLAGCKASPLAMWREANYKAKEMMEYEAKYLALLSVHEKLKSDYYILEHQHLTLLSEVQSVKNAHLNLAATGAKDGRRLASIDYQVPANISPDDLYVLAFEHLREERLPEAAATLEKLFHLPEAAALQNATAFYNAGVIWFKLRNYKKAKKYFDLTLVKAEGEERGKYKGRVDLWQRSINLKMSAQTRGLASGAEE